jgi:hypothetical protein
MPILTDLDALLSDGAGQLTILAVVVIGLILLIEVIHGQTRQRRRRIAADLLTSFRKGWRRGWRGCFAPVHRRPWRAAWRAWRAPTGSWQRAVVAWFAAIEAMIDEQR